MWVIAHRGASGFAPENTLAAFETAMEMGASFIETDLQLSRDAHLVAIHDETLDRTTNGSGLVAAKTLDELRQLDAGAWFKGNTTGETRPHGEPGKGSAWKASFAGERIPTIAEVLAFGKRRDAGLYLELKPRGPSGVEHNLVGALRAADEILRTVVLSFDRTTLMHVRRLEPLLVTGYLCEKSEGVAEQAVEVGARQLLPRADQITPELLAEAHRRDLKVVAWTVNDPAQMRALIAAGVDGIITNYPNELVKALAEK
jgi:glycerophosphoryl diester phosphodiesterase